MFQPNHDESCTFRTDGSIVASCMVILISNYFGFSVSFTGTMDENLLWLVNKFYYRPRRDVLVVFGHQV